jgi:phosphotransferase system enzyme I (PtsP)
VPIVRGGQVFGVLTVQNKAERIYAEEEVEALQTVAMVLAEWWRKAASSISPTGRARTARRSAAQIRRRRPVEGVAVGRIVLHGARACRVERMIADNPVDGAPRLEEATSAACACRWTRCCRPATRSHRARAAK